MKRRLFNLFIPNSIRGKLYRMYVNQYLFEEVEKWKENEANLLSKTLSSEYIKKLVVLVNQNELLIHLPKASVVAEIGSGSGKFTQKIIAITSPKKLFMIETWPKFGEYEISVIENIFKSEINHTLVELINDNYKNGLIRIKDASLDWVFLNTQNSNFSTFELLEICLVKVKPSGYIAGNNYARGDWITSQIYDVIESVHEFCKKYGWEMVFITHEPHRKLSYILKKFD
jgi:hypothetical protein